MTTSYALANRRSVEVRSKRSALKRLMKEGAVSLALALRANNDYVQTMSLRQLLLATPGIGPAKADEALKALTINAAEMLGVGDRIGSIERGKLGNLIVTRGDPLEVRTQVTHVVIAGRDVPLDNRHLVLYERYSKRP